MLLTLSFIALAAALTSTGCGRIDRSNQIVIWEQMDPAEQDLLDQHIASFRIAHPEFSDFEITRLHYNTEDLRTQFQTAAMAYGGPNLVYGPTDQVGPFTIMGLIEPLDEMLSAEALESFDPMGLPTLNGHVWGLPDQVGNHLTMVANDALVDSIPDNTDAWLDQLRTLTVDEDGDGRPEVYGAVFDMVEPFFLLPWLGGFGGWVMDDEANPTLDSPGMVASLEFLLQLKREGLVPQECDYPLADTLFKNGRAAYIINGPWSWGGYQDGGLSITLAPIPRVSSTGLWPSPSTAAKAYSVNRYLDPATREATIALLLWLTGPEAQINLARELGVLPSNLEVRAMPELVEDPMMAASRSQLDKGRLMPVVPEMRAVWDSVRPYYQSVLNGDVDATTAAREMQARAVRTIATMKE